MPEKKDLNVSTFLYSSWRSSCSYRVRICLNLKQIPFKIMPIDLMSLTKSSDNKDYNLNPMQFLPSLVIDGHTLIESMVMMEYLDETRPQPWLLPRDSFQRAQVRTICEIIISGIQPLQNTGVLNYIGDIFGKKEEAWAKYWITKGFTALEKLLTHCAGRYCVGDEITLADCCLVPQVFNARRFHLDLESYPNIVRIDRDLHNHSAFRLAHPMCQPDFPAELLTDMNFFPAKL